MFDSIRKHQRLLQFVLLLLILPAFVFFGVSGYQRFLSDADQVASVGGDRISQQEFAEAQRRQLDNLRQMLGDQVDPKMLDSDAARNEVLEGLIAQKALLAEAAAKRISVSDERLRESIASIPGLKSADGTFDMTRYRAMLSSQNLNEGLFESQMRRDIALQAIPQSVIQTVVLPKAVLDRVIALQEEVREVRAIVLKPEQFAAEVKPSADALKRHYEENARAYETPESATVEYLVFDASGLAGQVVIEPAKIRDFYEQNKSRYAVEEQRQASHILLTVAKDAPEDARKAARAKAEGFVKQLRGGADFAALAKAQSQDAGSAPNGGDLGVFGREMMVKPFADAAFALKPGEISDVVETEFGFHVIKVSAIKPKTERSFESVKGEIEAEFRKQESSKAFAKEAENFSNTVYEQAESLKPAADRFKLAVQTAQGVTRVGPSSPDASGAKSPLANPKLLAALFSDDSLKTKRNTEAIEVAPNTLVSARIVSYRPAERKPFESVEPQVRERVVAIEAQAKAVKVGEERLKALQAGGAAEGFGEMKQAKRGGSADFPPSALDDIFRIRVDKLPAYVGVNLGQGGYGLYQVSKVVPPASNIIEERRASYQPQVAQVLAQEEFSLYLDALKARSKVRKNLSGIAARGDAR
jgi:peptidyl-prolyl cis-trans isomerase D